MHDAINSTARKSIKVIVNNSFIYCHLLYTVKESLYFERFILPTNEFLYLKIC